MTMSENYTVSTPTFLIDKKRCLANIRRMVSKANDSRTKLRPHCKTHASREIAQWQREEGNITGITVSSLSMAEYFSADWKDITVAFPVNILEVDTIQKLIDNGVTLNLLVENIEAINYLEDRLNGSVGFFLKIDVGYGRTGIPAKEVDRINPILTRSETCRRLSFLGFLTHAGHTYHATSRDQVIDIHNTSKKLLLDLKAEYIGRFPDLIVSMGDTPSCTIVDAESWKEIDEMRPGNFVFYDLEQAQIGSCGIDDIAVAVACPIVAKHPHRREMTLYGGGVHFSKDRLVDREGKTVYGLAVKCSGGLEWGSALKGVYVRSLSQEHGIAVVSPDEDFDQFQIGDILGVLPVHSCMTADVSKNGYRTTNGEIVQRMRE